MPATVYSARLGAIADSQFDAALADAGLGRFVAASSPSDGLFGQNVYLTSTTGEFVFRGAPHWYQGGPNDAWQFPKERLYADLLHNHTRVPVAWPQILDDSRKHFPWPYLIMPRLPGVSLAATGELEALPPEERLAVARAMGEALAGLHALAWPFSGDFDPAAQGLVPYEGGYRAHLAGEVRRLRDEGRQDGLLSADDEAWLNALLAADAVTPEPDGGTYIHNDYHLGNVLLARQGANGHAEPRWAVTGVVDLMTSAFGDPAADLARLAFAFLDRDPPCAGAFLAAYRAAGGPAHPGEPRLALLVAYERLLIWSYFKRPDVDADWLKGQAFTAWTRRYLDRLALLLAEPG
ncbi:MAG: aminoglycoside phosphotransferase family protein [Proteobacteria bacterium]|nr:aminoglycoside phosphotransferase family protein [Pseudomonadota bacterium]